MPTGRYSRVNLETDPNVLSDAQTAATFRPGVRIPWVIVSVLVTGLVSIICTYMSTHSAPPDCASSGDMHAVNQHVDELNRTVTALTQTVNANADRENNHFAIVNGTLLTLARQK
jgi:hypothetical protein